MNKRKTPIIQKLTKPDNVRHHRNSLNEDWKILFTYNKKNKLQRKHESQVKKEKGKPLSDRKLTTKQCGKVYMPNIPTSKKKVGQHTVGLEPQIS